MTDTSSSTANRVRSNTDEEINRRIRQETERRLAYYELHPEEIQARLAELDREWDIERTLEANAATLAFTGVVLGSTIGRRWFALPALVSAFLFQHAVEGWCPPLPILRRLGFRTADEINEERLALKALRGDFDLVAEAGDKLAAIWKAVRPSRA
jgi:hypothetical protein